MRLRRAPFLGITDKMKSVRVWYRFLSCGKKTTWTPSDVLGGIYPEQQSKKCAEMIGLNLSVIPLIKERYSGFYFD